MEPYYKDENTTLYCGRCEEILPRLDIKADLCLTDPPYGIKRDGQVKSYGKHGGRKAYDFGGWDSVRPDAEIFGMMLQSTRSQIIWGGNYFADLLPAHSQWLVWDKGQRINQSDGELAWTSFDGALRICTLNRIELLFDGAVHPTQKPIALMRWCMDSIAEWANTILDPFCGSGTTLVAAKLLKRKSIGIEMSEKYCEIIVNRLNKPMPLFDKPEQLNIL